VTGDGDRRTVVLDVSGLRWAIEQNVVEAVLGRRPGVLDVDVNPLAQTATVVVDPTMASVSDPRDWVTADMHNRFLVALLFSFPIVLWSPIGSRCTHDDRPQRPDRGTTRPDSYAMTTAWVRSRSPSLLSTSARRGATRTPRGSRSLACTSARSP
jgi:copper chaperone CopZ